MSRNLFDRVGQSRVNAHRALPSVFPKTGLEVQRGWVRRDFQDGELPVNWELEKKKKKQASARESDTVAKGERLNNEKSLRRYFQACFQAWTFFPRSWCNRTFPAS